MTRLVLLRHGESTGNREKRMGRGDYALTEDGWHQAHALGQCLAQDSPRPTHLIISPARRSRQTLEAVLTGLGIQGLQPFGSQRSQSPDPETALGFRQRLGEMVAHQGMTLGLDDRLQEIDNGIFCGLTWPEALARYPEVCQRLQDAPQWIPIPGAESPQQCWDRARSWVAEITALGSSSVIWTVTHGGILPYLLGALWGSDRIWGFQAEPTARFELEWDGDRWPDALDPTASHQNAFNATLWRILRFNDRCHWPGSG
ncbi:histidine phosphatase family protein [Prochlorothrix hollandica]|uniref:Phosphoglycerate mutase n=1 Tax=Prochlorothrix hollandica PCC 9006 = CALU 1027 TaxID=317619 RepID=A0A0M2PUZ9_PROHO|nr:histidine phosphatase family protein [Prochlorothrix hollandica]KKI98201.1 hypothetical protein PROH_21235 [Prochlorothrix hollandica PCC 9006 = CALU 1027]